MEKITYEQLLESLDVEQLKGLVNECDNWNGCFEDLRVYEFDDEFFETYFQKSIDAAQAVFFGNIQSWNDEYIRFNGNGNLVSLSEWDYEKEIEERKEEIVEKALELYQDNHIYVDSDVEELFDSYLMEDDEE